MKKLIVLLSAVALILAFTLPATAADEIQWNWYGNARVKTFWTSNDSGDSTIAGTGGKTEDSALEWQFQGNSRIGFRVKGGPIGGVVELRTNAHDQGAGQSTVDANFAHLAGSWNFGAGTLTVGKTQPPVYQFVSGEIYDDGGFIGPMDGASYSRRRGLLGLKFGAFEFALVEPRTGTLGTTGGDPDTVLPKFEARWGMGFDWFSFNLMGGYQYFEINDAVYGTSTKNVDVNSWILAGDATANFGPFYIKGAVDYGINNKVADWLPGNSEPTTNNSGDVKDIKTFGTVGVVGFKLTDMVTFEGGVSYVAEKSDANGTDTDKQMRYYIQSVLQMAPGVFFIPEFMYLDRKDSITGADEGNEWFLGGKWQINF
jgi:hypothetical protein